MKLSCFIIDDEPLALGLLETYVNRTDFLVLTGKYSSALAAVEAICQERPNLVFLDIQMADLNGLEFAKSIPSDTRIIFTTAFEQYALESYRLNALDYLLKPFSYADFLRAATKVLQWYELKHKAEEMGGDVVKDSVFIKVDYKLVRLEIRRILYIEGFKDYIRIYLEDDSRPLMTHMTLKAFEAMLPSDKFMRVHKSFIVHTDKIKEVEKNKIIFGKIRIPVSESYRDLFQSYINGKTISE